MWGYTSLCIAYLRSDQFSIDQIGVEIEKTNNLVSIGDLVGILNQMRFIQLSMHLL